MSVSNTVSKTSSQSRIDALREKHRVLSDAVCDAAKHPATTDFYLNQLKKQKLVIKEEIADQERHVAH